LDKSAASKGHLSPSNFAIIFIDRHRALCKQITMPGTINIATELTRKLDTKTEVRLLRDAVQHNPGSVSLRLRLARLLNKLDLFAESIELLTEVGFAKDHLGAKLALITAYFARNAAGDNALAKHVAESVASLAQNDMDRSHLLAELAKAHLRLGENEAALPLLREALALNPTNVNAFKRLALELLHQNQPQQVIMLTDSLKQQGARHSRLLAARMMAFAALGETEDAQQLLGASEFIYAEQIQTPTGWPDLAAFNAALAMEISNNPGMRFERYGTSSEKAWRVDHPATGNTPAVSALLAEIVRIAKTHTESCAGLDHAWPAACPDTAILRSWCVMTEGDGFEKWHMHPEGWMSGGYYAEVPAAVANGTDEAGCLAFGVPGGLIGEAAAQNIQQTHIRPIPGLLTLFPSHAYHRTFPHKGTGRRMCIAFDICPA
jgi:tetratricopeptide (TPR) repeat protein